MNVFLTVWFWLLILSIIGFIIAFILFWTVGSGSVNFADTPLSVWIVFIISILLWVIAIILYAFDNAIYARDYAAAVACGDIIPKKPECPRDKDVCAYVPRPRSPGTGTMGLPVITTATVVPVISEGSATSLDLNADVQRALNQQRFAGGPTAGGVYTSIYK